MNKTKEEILQPHISTYQSDNGESDFDFIWPENASRAMDEYTTHLTDQIKSMDGQVKGLREQRKYWHDNWNEIIKAVLPKSSGCRDCADENGICPSSKLPCDPTKAVVHLFSSLQSQLESLQKENAKLTIILSADNSDKLDLENKVKEYEELMMDLEYSYMDWIDAEGTQNDGRFSVEVNNIRIKAKALTN